MPDSTLLLWHLSITWRSRWNTQRRSSIHVGIHLVTNEKLMQVRKRAAEHDNSSRKTPVSNPDYPILEYEGRDIWKQDKLQQTDERSQITWRRKTWDWEGIADEEIKDLTQDTDTLRRRDYREFPIIWSESKDIAKIQWNRIKDWSARHSKNFLTGYDGNKGDDLTVIVTAEVERDPSMCHQDWYWPSVSRRCSLVPVQLNPWDDLERYTSSVFSNVFLRSCLAHASRRYLDILMQSIKRVHYALYDPIISFFERRVVYNFMLLSGVVSDTVPVRHIYVCSISNRHSASSSSLSCRSSTSLRLDLGFGTLCECVGIHSLILMSSLPKILWIERLIFSRRRSHWWNPSVRDNGFDTRRPFFISTSNPWLRVDMSDRYRDFALKMLYVVTTAQWHWEYHVSRQGRQSALKFVLDIEI